MRRCLRSSVCLMMLAGGSVVSAQTQEALRAMYKANQVFALRDAVASPAAPPFYRAAVEASANQIKLAEKDLHSIIEAAPHSDDAFQAHDLLGSMYSRNGMYRDAFREVKAASHERPGNADMQNGFLLFKAISEAPPQILVKRKPSKLQIEKNSIDLPLRIDGKEAAYFFDTGAAISVLGQSEAKQFGLTTREVNGKLNDSSGTGVTGLRIAIAKDVVIGGLHLKNVPFLVLSDDGEPWIEMPQNRRGIIGLPILLAMQTVRWKPTGSFEFGFPAKDLHLAQANMLFHSSTPVVQVVVDNRKLDFSLDTGAVDTDLNPPFARALPALLKTGSQRLGPSWGWVEATATIRSFYRQ